MQPVPLHSAPTCWWWMWAAGGTFLLGVAFRHVICGFYLFFLPVRLPSEIWKLPPDPPVRGFPGVWKHLLLRLPFWDGSRSLALLSLFLSFIFCPTSFQRQWAAFLGTWCPLLGTRSCFFVVCSMFNCSFDEFVGEKVVSQEYISVSSDEVDESRTYYTQWSESESER